MVAAGFPAGVSESLRRFVSAPRSGTPRGHAASRRLLRQSPALGCVLVPAAVACRMDPLGCRELGVLEWISTIKPIGLLHRANTISLVKFLAICTEQRMTVSQPHDRFPVEQASKRIDLFLHGNGDWHTLLRNRHFSPLHLGFDCHSELKDDVFGGRELC